MDKFIIRGPSALSGEIRISGSKNAALPLMAASVLAGGTVKIRNVPLLNDIYTFNNVLRVTGVRVDFDEERSELLINPANLNYPEAPYDLVRKMRASFYMLGALAGKTGRARVSLPGGCAWGPRPVDLHLKGMKAIGYDIELDEGYVVATAGSGILKGGSFKLEPSSVGATVNLLLGSVLRAEKFTIKNAAREPDVQLLCKTLVKMGADIEGIGTDTLTIRRVPYLSAIEIANAPDRIETGTFMIAAAMHPESDVILTGCNPEELGSFPDEFLKTGAEVEMKGDVIKVKAPDNIRPVSVKTEIYPGFPTDLQAQWATMMTQASGISRITDNIYFDRFSYVPELNRLGADLKVDKNRVIVNGKAALEGASVMSTDLRASVSLVMAGMCADGVTEVLRVYHLDRGYEKLEEKLNRAGARIERIKQGETVAEPENG